MFSLLLKPIGLNFPQCYTPVTSLVPLVYIYPFVPFFPSLLDPEPQTRPGCPVYNPVPLAPSRSHPWVLLEAVASLDPFTIPACAPE